MNILSEKAIRNCTSCQICSAVCPTSAIIIQLNNNGFYRPVIDDNKCIDCGQCVDSCYKFDHRIIQTNSLELSKIPVYAAYSFDNEIVKNTTSGGIAHLLCTHLISKGFKCVGVAYDIKSETAVNRIALTPTEAETFKGSKYIQSYSEPALKEIISIDKTSKYAIFGTPCQIYSIKKYADKHHRNDNFVFIDIFCHGCPSVLVWKRYLREIYKIIPKEHINTILFRSKVRGWGNFCVYAKGENGKKYVGRKTNDGFFTLFFSNMVLNDACYDCKLRGTYSYTDIRLGDFWGKEYDMNTKGVSLVVTPTDKGRILFNEISDSIWKKKHEHKDYLPYQSYGHIYAINKPLRNTLLEMLQNEKNNINDIVAFYIKQLPFIARIKLRIKNTIFYYPRFIQNLLKKIYH